MLVDVWYLYSCVWFQLHIILKSFLSGKYTMKWFFLFKNFRPKNIPPILFLPLCKCAHRCDCKYLFT